MKKSITLFAISLLLSSIFVEAQVQRMVLAEGYSNASCGPCATQNPAYNTLLGANTTKVIAIKYQTNWPGFDPMNVQTQTEVAPRVSYYSITGVPHGRLDGTAIAGGSYAGALNGLDQAEIDARYAVGSPFLLDVSHSLSDDLDSIFITVDIEADINFTANGTLKLHVLATETQIQFASAPGSNGETNFYHVMRKMYPNASGTTLSGSWTAGNTQTVTFASPIPTYIYDFTKVEVVAFIQDDGNKVVQQAAYSAPQPVSDYGKITAMSGLPTLECTGSFAPSVTVKNLGTTTMTSATINYQVDNNTPLTAPWTGSLATGATSNSTLPAITGVSGGYHTLKVWLTDINGNGGTAQLHVYSGSFNVATTASVLPLAESFTPTLFPPANFGLVNPDNGITWARVSTGNTANSMRYNCYSYGTQGQQDMLIVKSLDLTGITSATLTFDVAHAQYSSSYSDGLQVEVSTNCGSNWTSVFLKSGSTLATAATTTSSFTPSASQWRLETVDLSAYVGNADVYIRFKGLNDYGNNIYVDNINVSSSSGIDDVNSVVMNLYPNPANEVVNISLSLSANSEVSLEVINSVGQKVISRNLGIMSGAENITTLDVSALSAGMYMMNIIVDGKATVKPFIKQ